MATISDDTIAISIIINDEDVQSRLKKVNDKLDDVGDTAEDTSKRASQGFTNLGKSVIVLNQSLDLAQRAFSFLRNTVEGIGNTLNQAGQVDALTRSFDTLQASVGQDSVKALEDLRTSTNGLISDFKLMEASNRAIQLGLPTEGFDEAAGAAIRLGRAMGIDATQAINDFTTGVGRGSVQILDNLGIIVKANDAYEKFAQANGTTVQALTETEKKLAFQQAAYEAVLKSAENTADVTLNSADAYEQLGATFDNVKNDVLAAIANNDTLKDSLIDLTKTLKEVDAQQLADALSELASIVIKTADGIVFLGQAIGFAFSQQAKTQKDVITSVQRLTEQYGKFATDGIKSSLESMKLLDREMNLSKQEADRYRKVLDGLEKQSIAVGDSSKFTSFAIGTLREQIDLAEKRTEQLNIKLKETPKIIKEVDDEADKLGRTIDKQSAIWDGFAESIGGALQSIASGGDFDIGKIIGTGVSGILSSTVEERIDADGKTIGISLGQTISENLGSTLGEYLPEQFAGIAGNIGASLIAPLAQQVAENTVSGINAAFSGDRLNTAEKLSLALPTFGGSLIFDDLKKALFGDQDPAANAREAVEGWFNEAIKTAENESGVFIDRFSSYGRDSFDQFVNSAGETTTLIGEKFKEVSADSQAFFLGIGTGLESIINNPDLVGGQLGQLLAANFGAGANSANDLQLLLQSMNVSAEQVAQQLEQAWLRGDIAAGEFLNGLVQTEELFTQGIPNAIGATGEAFDNLVNGGLQSGRQALDALGDIGAEALEGIDKSGTGAIKTLDELKDSLIAQNKPVEEVDRLFQAFAQNGITNVQQLKDVTVQQAAGITNSLQGLGFGFSEVGDDIKQLAKDVENIKSKKVDIDVNIRTNVDSNTREYQRLITDNSGSLGGQ